MSKDFSNHNLRGRSFVGIDLSGANFENADIQGANFSKAILRGANFSYAKAGLNNIAVTFLFIVSLLLAVISGLSSGFVGYLLTYFSQPKFIIAGGFPPVLAIFIVLGIFVAVLLRVDITTALKSFGIAFIIASILSLPGALVALVGWLGFIVGAVATAQTIYVTGKIGEWVVVGLNLLISATLAIVGSREMTRVVAETSNTIALGTELTSILFAVAFPLLAVYVSRRALFEDERFILLQRLIIAFAAIGRGTNFRGADLTDANFTNAFLASADLTNTIIHHTCWRNAHQLDFAKVGGTILSQPTVRDLLVTGKAQREFLVRKNFKGANLAYADLTQANFTECDLSEATFQGAYLEKANLTKTIALGTDFRGALLTGACIESWQINRATLFDGVVCDYIYFAIGHKQRRPVTENFAPGEFQQLFN